MRQDELQTIYAELQELLRDRLNVKARSFPAAVRKAGRLLNAPARGAAADLLALERRLENPKLAQKTDPAVARQAADTIRAALARHKPGARAARDRAFLLANIAVKVLLVLGLVLTLMYLGAAPN